MIALKRVIAINYTVTLIDDKGLNSEAVISSDPPTIGGTIGVTINQVSGTVLHGSDYYTKNTSVTLRLSAATDNVNGVTGYHTTNDDTRPDTNVRWEPWDGNNLEDSPSHNLAEPTVDGVKYIHVWLKDASGNVFLAATVKVTLATKVPTITVAINQESGTVHTGDNKYHTENKFVTLRLTPLTSGRGITGYQINNEKPAINSGSWVPWNGNSPINSLDYTLNTTSPQTISAWIIDVIGNVFSAGDVEVTLAKGVPIIESASIGGKVVNDNGKINLTNATHRKLVITTNGKQVAYQITATASAPDSEAKFWVKDEENKTINIETRSFAHNATIYIWLKDAIGNVSVVFPVFITNSIVYLDPTDSSSKEDGSSSEPVKTMDKAINLLGDSDYLARNATILLKSTITSVGNTIWYVATPLTLRSYSDFFGTMISVTDGTLTLENIIIDGENRSRESLVTVNRGSTLNLNNGVVIQNGNTTSNGGGVYLKGGDDVYRGGILNMNGTAQISNNTAQNGGGVFLDETPAHKSNSILNMNETAQISNNTAQNGGGVSINGLNVKITMSGAALITGNNVGEDGGGVFVSMGRNDGKNNTLVMSGTARISDNTAQNGGGVFFSTSRVNDSNETSFKLIMSGVTQISDNTAIKNGGGLHGAENSGFSTASLFTSDVALVTKNVAQKGGGWYTSSNINNPSVRDNTGGNINSWN